jgi:hypothetical protein
MTRARQIWANVCSNGIEESVSQYFHLQQREAAGQVKDLEHALDEIRHLEQERGDLWAQAAHDLRGNLGVVAFLRETRNLNSYPPESVSSPMMYKEDPMG